MHQTLRRSISCRKIQTVITKPTSNTRPPPSPADNDAATLSHLENPNPNRNKSMSQALSEHLDLTATTTAAHIVPTDKPMEREEWKNGRNK